MIKFKKLILFLFRYWNQLTKRNSHTVDLELDVLLLHQETRLVRETRLKVKAVKDRERAKIEWKCKKREYIVINENKIKNFY